VSFHKINQPKGTQRRRKHREKLSRIATRRHREARRLAA
jgi:hypothetical protein